MVWPNCWFSQLHHSLESHRNCVSCTRTKSFISSVAAWQRIIVIAIWLLDLLTIITGISGGMLIACQYGFSATMKMRALLIQTSKECGYIQAYGMQTIGQLEAGLSRPIGGVHHSRPGFIVSGQGLASGVMGQWAFISVPPMSQQIGGLLAYTRGWVMLRLATWTGSERTSWYMTTAQITKDSTDRSLPNAPKHNSKGRAFLFLGDSILVHQVPNNNPYLYAKLSFFLNPGTLHA